MGAKASEPETAERKTVYADVPADLHRRVVIRAYDEKKSIARLVQDALEQYLEKVPA